MNDYDKTCLNKITCYQLTLMKLSIVECKKSEYALFPIITVFSN